MEAACRRVKIGTLGATDGVSAGAPELLLEFEPPESRISLHAAGVFSAGSAPPGHAVCPSGVDATPAATSAPSLVTHEAPATKSGQCNAQTSRMNCRLTKITGEQV